MFSRPTQIAVWVVIGLIGPCAWALVPGFWRIQVVTADMPTLYSGSLAFWPDGRPAVSYSGAGLKYAEWDGSDWQITTVSTEIAVYNSLAVLANGPAIAFDTNWGPIDSLQFASRTAGTWSMTLLESPSEPTYRGPIHLAANPGTGLPIFVEAWNTGGAGHAVRVWQFDGQAWRSESAFGLYVNGIDVNGCALSFLPGGNPVVAYSYYGYSAGTYGYLGWAERGAGGVWTSHDIQSLPGYMFTGVGSAVVDGALSICDVAQGELWYWFPKTRLGPGGANTSPAVLPDGQPALAYYSGGLRFMSRTNSGWRSMAVDPAGADTRFTSLAIHPITGQPGIAYYDDAAGQVKFALAFFRGDLNCDGLIDFDDINPFVLALTDPAGYAQAFPDCNIVDADVNEDGVANFEDINPFVALLAQ